MSEIYSCLKKITDDFLKSQSLIIDKAEGLRPSEREDGKLYRLHGERIFKGLLSH